MGWARTTDSDFVKRVNGVAVEDASVSATEHHRKVGDPARIKPEADLVDA